MAGRLPAISLLVCCLVVRLEASIYDDDYDSYTKPYDYRTSGKSSLNTIVKEKKIRSIIQYF